MSKQPRDDGNDPIPVLGLRPGRGQQIVFSGVSSRSTAISNSVRVVTLYATQDAFIETGDATVEANGSTSHFLPAGIPYDISLGAETDATNNDKYVAVVAAADSGTLYLSERE
jgi:hypothetical protein